MNKINFVFDRISDQGIPVGNILCYRNDITREQAEFTKDLTDAYYKGFWYEYVVFNSTFKQNFKSEYNDLIKFIKTSELEDHKQDLNIYPIFCHGVGGVTAFTIENLFYVDKKIINAVNNGYAKIALLNLYDCYCPSHPEIALKIIQICNLAKITNLKNIILACSDNDQWVTDMKVYLSSYGQNVPTIVNSHWWEHVTKRHVTAYYQDTDFLDLYSNTNKEKIFTSTINRPYAYRYFLYKYLEKENLLDYGFVSWRREADFNRDGDFKSIFYNKMRHYNEDPIIENKLLEFENYLEKNPIASPKILEENGIIIANENFCPTLTGTKMDPNWIKNSIFTIVTETIFEINFLSEKTYKLFYYCHPFIFYGEQGTLQKIRNLGYKTFPMLFDESYDLLPHNSYHKLDLIGKQIKQYTTPEGKEKLIRVMPEVCDVLNHNRKRFLESNNYDFWSSLR